MILLDTSGGAPQPSHRAARCVRSTASRIGGCAESICQLTASFLSDKIASVRLHWASSSAKHGITQARTRYVLTRAGLVYIQRATPPDRPLDQLVFLGDDRGGMALEVMAVELANGDLLVIHAMPLRPKYRAQYQEALRWQR